MADLTPERTMTLFTSDCGHRFIGVPEGTYECPVCGRYDGDGHLTDSEHLPMQEGLDVTYSWGKVHDG